MTDEDAALRLRRNTPAESADLAGRGSGSCATPKARVIVRHEKERLRAGPMFASSTSPGEADGRGHRRGLDGPTMPHTLLKL